MRSHIAFAIIASLVTAEGASAKIKFENYDARDSIVEGKGGSRTTKNGIDFWTMGDPPRRYQIIGIIRDNRGTGPLYGDAVGSSRIAKMVRETGGNAVILLNQNASVKGIFASGQSSVYGNQAFGSGWAVPIQERLTTFAVVKYLTDPEGTH